MIAHFGSFLLWLPAGMLAASIWNPLVYVVLPALIVAFLGGSVVVSTLHCPRCGNKFFDFWFDKQIGWIFRRRCHHCQLKRGAPYDPGHLAQEAALDHRSEAPLREERDGHSIDERWRTERERYSRAWQAMSRGNAMFGMGLVIAAAALFWTRLAFFPAAIVAAGTLVLFLARRAAVQCPRCRSSFSKGLFLPKQCQSCGWPRDLLPKPHDLDGSRGIDE
jgi:hypothetical protein